MASSKGALKIEITVDDNGSIKVKKFGKEVEKTGAKGKKAFRGMATSAQGFNNIVKSINLKAIAIGAAAMTAAAAYGAKKLTDEFLEAATAAESYKVRLNALLGTQQESARLFKTMSDYAARVPFQFNEIMAAATTLSGVMKAGADEVARYMPLIGDLAAVSGLSIQDTASQIIRMYSASAGAADMFRERGILAMLGFKAGVAYTTKETKKIMFEAWEGVDSKFRGVTYDLGKTWTGTMSMFSDQWFQFRNMVMDTSVFDAMKQSAQETLNTIQEMKKDGRLDEWARDMAVGVLLAMQSVVGAFGFVKKSIEAIKLSILGLDKVLLKARIFTELWGTTEGRHSVRADELVKQLKYINGEIIDQKKAFESSGVAIDAAIAKLEKMKFAANVVATAASSIPPAIKTGATQQTASGYTHEDFKLMDKINQQNLTDLQKAAAEEAQKYWLEVWDNVAEAAKETLSTGIADAAKGEFDSIEDYFKSLTDSMIDIWADVVVEIATKEIVANITANIASSAVGSAAGGAAADAGLGVGGWLGLGAVGLGLSALGGLFGGDDGPSEQEIYVQTMRDLIEATEKNVAALERQLNPMSEWTDAFAVVLDIASEIASLPLPLGMARRKTMDEAQEYIAENPTFVSISDTTEDQFKAFWNYYKALSTLADELELTLKTVVKDIDQSIIDFASGVGVSLPTDFALDWADVTFETAPLTDYGIAVKGVTDETKVVTAGLMELAGVLRDTGLEWDASVIDARIEKINEIEAAQLAAVNEMFGAKIANTFQDSALYINQFTGEMSDIQIAIDNVTKTYDDYRETLIQSGATISQLADLERDRAIAMQAAATAPFKSLLEEIESWQTSIQRQDWGTDEWSKHFSDLSEEIANLDRNSTTYWDDMLDLSRQQKEALQNINTSIEQQTAQSKQIVDSANDALWNLRGGSLAAVQSIGGHQERYDELRTAALSGDRNAASDFINFATNDYYSFMSSAGMDLQSLTDILADDVEAVRDYYQSDIDILGEIAANTADVAENTGLGGSIVSRLTDVIAALGADVTEQIKQQNDATAWAEQVSWANEQIGKGAGGAGAGTTATLGLAPETPEALEANIAALTEGSNKNQWLYNWTAALAILSNEGYSQAEIMNEARSVMRTDPGSWAKTFNDGREHGFQRIGSNFTWYGEGGGIVGERGPELILPLYEPQHTNMLNTLGLDPDAIGQAIVRHAIPAIANHIAPLLADNGEDGEKHYHFHVDGREFALVVDEAAHANPEAYQHIANAWRQN